MLAGHGDQRGIATLKNPLQGGQQQRDRSTRRDVQRA
jgi:hypothetical protein